MASTFFGLDIALTGMYASQLKLNTTAHNISNAQTEGYSKQVVGLEAADALRSYSTAGMVGTGVTNTGVTTNRSLYYDKKYWNSSSMQGEYETKEYYLKSIENHFNEVGEDGTIAIYDNFFAAMSELSTDCSSLEKRTALNQLGETFTQYVGNMYTSLQNAQDDINTEMKNCVDNINSIAEEIVGINREINNLEVTGATANDLRDKRATLIDKLSSLVSVEVEERSINKTDTNKGQQAFCVKINGQILLDTYNYNTLECVPRKELANQNDADGLYNIVWKTTQESFNVKGSTVSGKLKALYELRDGNNLENFKGTVQNSSNNSIVVTGQSINDINKLNIAEEGYITVGTVDYKYSGFEVEIDNNGNYEYTFNLNEELNENLTQKDAAIGKSVNYKGIPYYQAQLNEFVRTFSEKFNSIHNKGIDLNGEEGVDYFNYADKVNGVQKNENTNKEVQLKEKEELENEDKKFNSKDASYYKMTAGNFKVSDEILSSSSKIATTPKKEGNVSDGVENNDIILQLVGLKTDKNMFKQGTPAQFIQTIVTELAVDTSSVEKLGNNQSDISKTIDNKRLSISGVDLDEESMDLLKFQKAYELSAKVFSVMSEIYETLIQMG